MGAAKLNLKVEQGVTYRHILQLKALGVIFDLSSYTARMQMRKNVNSPVVLLNITSNAGDGITIDGATGVLTLVISATQTGALLANSAVYDLEIESSGGEVTRVVQGTVAISKQVTR